MVQIPRTILDCLPDAVILLDSEREVVHANRAARDIIEGDMTGRDLALSFRHPAVLDAVDRVLAGAADADGEVTLPVPVSRTYQVNAIALPTEADPQDVRVVLVLHDVTSARRAEQTRADFVANASHELRSPLSSMLGFIETLKGPASEDTDARRRFLDIMHREARRMTRLIDDLLSLSRVEINEHVRPRGRIEVGPILKNVAEFLEPQAEARGMAIELELADNLAALTGDADELSQVFRNLIENAIKYGGEKTAVRVKAERVSRVPGAGGEGIAVSVADQGPGIPRDSIPRLTERFYRVDEARSRDGSDGVTSTGLGLAIVKHIVSRHRGRLSVDSELGKGSVFTVILPAESPAVQDDSSVDSVTKP